LRYRWPRNSRQLRIESQQSGRLFRITAGRSLPFEQAASTVELSDGVHVGHEVVLPEQRLGELDLQVAPRLADANPVILGEAIE
jgi:hypothetical protein